MLKLLLDSGHDQSLSWVFGKVKPSAVIVILIYYNDKIEIYNRRPMLANFGNPIIGKPVYMKKNLFQHDLAIQKRANVLYLVTMT